MPISLDDFAKLRSKVEKAKRLHGEAIGALQQLMTELKDEYGSEDSREGRKKLERMKERRQEILVKYNRAMKRFEREFSELEEE